MLHVCSVNIEESLKEIKQSLAANIGVKVVRVKSLKLKFSTDRKYQDELEQISNETGKLWALSETCYDR